MSKIHLIIGPVGAGKSTFARQLCRDIKALHLSLDAWMSKLFAADRPDSGLVEWYVERAQRCVDALWQLSGELVAIDVDVVLEIGLLKREQREDIYARARKQDIELVTYVLDAPRDVRRERVHMRNRERGATFSMVVSPEVFEFASDLWEAPTADECCGRDIRLVAQV